MGTSLHNINWARFAFNANTFGQQNLIDLESKPKNEKYQFP